MIGNRHWERAKDKIKAFESFWLKELTVDEVEVVVKKLKNGKRQGDDGIPNEVWKNAPPGLLNNLTTLINEQLRRMERGEQMLEDWRKSVVFTIWKETGSENVW